MNLTLAEDFDQELAAEQLYNAMRVSDSILFPSQVTRTMAADHHCAMNRGFAIEWMKKVMQYNSCDVRDCSISIFDTYITTVYLEDNSSIRDKRTLAFAAAASMTLGSKIIGSDEIISATNFTAFNTEDIYFFEKKVMMKAGSRISPFATPSYFLQQLTRYFDSNVDVPRLVKLASQLISEFREDITSLVFAPSTIAIASVMVAMPLLKISCPSFIDHLPNYFFPFQDAQLFKESNSKASYLDCAGCVQFMERLPSIRAPHSASSPVCVADDATLEANKFECVKL